MFTNKSYLVLEMESKSVIDLPEEVLEFILQKLSPYKDLKSASLVCKQWHRLVKGVSKRVHQNYVQKVHDGKLYWTPIQPEIGCRITERYSHCSCYFNKSVYIFGGCTSTNTTLNDLWRFDLTSREWIRPLAMGTYPFPKACASMVVYRDSLVLFGGWSHPTPYPLHQAARFFSELHVYSPVTNRWSHVTTLSQDSPKPTAGHSASVVGDRMIVFGGSQVPGVRTNDVWVFDFTEMAWKKQVTSNRKPSPRYGQSQVTVDANHILILGGCGGPNQIFNDIWLLTLDTDPWQWEEIKINNTEFAAPQIWCHPACKVGDTVVVLCKPAKPSKTDVPDNRSVKVQGNRVWVPPREESPNRNISHEQVRRQFQAHKDESEDSEMSHDQPEHQSEQEDENFHFAEPDPPTTAGVRPGMPSIRPNAMKNRQKQLEALLKYEKKLRQNSEQANKGASSSPEPGPSRENVTAISPLISRKTAAVRNTLSLMCVHILDISKVTELKEVTWRPLRPDHSVNVPEETIFYTLVEGRAELIMFGGIERDIQTMQRGMALKSHTVSNTLHILKPWEQTL